MQDRKISMEARPAFQYVKLVEEFIAFAANQLKDQDQLKGLRPVAEALESLRRTVQDPSGKYGVKTSLKSYEETRNGMLGTPDSLDKQYEKAIKEKQKAEEAYNNLPQQHEENLNKQKQLLQAKVEDMNLDQLKEIGITAKKNQKFIVDFQELVMKYTTKQAELRKLDAKIQSHCCGGALCNKKDLIRRRNLDHEINVLLSLQESVKANPVEAERSTEEVNEIKRQLDEIRKGIQDQIDGYEDKRKSARKKVADATKIISDINRKIDAYQLDQCRVVDRDTMFNFVHLRARLSNFYRVVDRTYKDDASTKLVLDSLTSARNEWRDKFNKSLGAIFYPTVTARSGLQFYSEYLDWTKTHKKEQQEIESAEYSPNEWINHIVPEIKKTDDNPLHLSTLGTVHDFFPTVDTIKKRRVERMVARAPASARPSLTTSSSSTNA